MFEFVKSVKISTKLILKIAYYYSTVECTYFDYASIEMMSLVGVSNGDLMRIVPNFYDHDHIDRDCHLIFKTKKIGFKISIINRVAC